MQEEQHLSKAGEIPTAATAPPAAGRVARVGAAIAALVALALLAPAAVPAAAAPPGMVAEDGFLGPASATPLSRAQARATWTPERIDGARPLTLAVATTSPDTAPRLLDAPPQTLKAMILDHPARYPKRVHGKLVGSFPGIGDYACSATVITSGSGSLLVTAGHCAYDVERQVAATDLAFVPGYARDSFPYGIWPITHLIVDKDWARGKLDHDYAMMRTVAPPALGSLQSQVGSRGIGFNQARKQRLQAFGYPAKGKPAYDGDKLVRCESGYLPDPYKSGGPRSRGMRCNQQQGSSGGGWVAKHEYVVSNTSHGYPRLSDNMFFGPYYGADVKRMYRAKTSFWPSVDPVRRKNGVPNLIGAKRGGPNLSG